MSEDEKKGYTVRDRRRFADDAPAENKAPADSTEPTPPAHDADPVPEASSSGEPATVDFASFVLSIATNAVMNLGGESPDGRVPGGRVNLSVASQHIDILAMLSEKTKGNLTPEESALLSSLLYDLRMHFVAVRQELGKGPAPR